MTRNSFAIKGAFCALAISSCLLQTHCSTAPTNKSAEPIATPVAAVTEMDKITKGAALVHIGGCNDCHSPKLMTPMGPIPDTTKLLSGHPANAPLPPITYDATKPGNWLLLSGDLTAAVGPWGMTFAANLTPDSATGLGSWTKENFINAMRKGKHLGQEGGRPILPPMPWPALGKLSNEELESMYLYLRSIPAISNVVKAPIPPDQIKVVK